MDQYIAYNTDAAHPMFVVLHHDGDNYGGGSDAYYHYNFQQMVAWATGNPDYDVTTVEDYLDRFPPATNDVIHVEDGAWAGANNGDAQFKKWMGDPDTTGWSPDLQQLGGRDGRQEPRFHSRGDFGRGGHAARAGRDGDEHGEGLALAARIRGERLLVLGWDGNLGQQPDARL